MQSHVRTFDYYGNGRKLPTFKQALNWNAMMKPPTKAFLEARQPKVKQAIKSDYLVEIWGGLMNTVDVDDELTVMASSVDYTMPVKYAPIVRRAGGVTAAFFFSKVSAQER